jgi:hypothetical protein
MNYNVKEVLARWCLAEGGGQPVRPGKVVCRAHATTEFGRVIAEEERDSFAALLELLGKEERSSRDGEEAS